MNIAGISAFYHDSACCLLQEGRLKAAASQERFSRLKHDPRLPVDAWRYCLQEGGLSPLDLDCVAYYESPALKLSRQLWAGTRPRGRDDLEWLDPNRPMRAIRERLGWEGPVLTFQHHLCHAASAFWYSPFSEAAVLTVDGVGEWATATLGKGGGEGLESLSEVHFPHSLGLVYSAFTDYLGFRVNDGEYKVMGLAPCGRPRFLEQLRPLIRSQPQGGFEIALEFFDFTGGGPMHSRRLHELLGAPPRIRTEPITDFHCDVACSLQRLTEEALLEQAAALYAKHPSENLCMAGGVALNCVANGRILREGPFSRLFVQPAAGDAGGCLGAAALALQRLTGRAPQLGPMRHAFWGPSWTADQMARFLESTGLRWGDFRGRPRDLVEETAGLLNQRRIVGWFQGRMEFGPRALGGRSILANPMDPEAQGRLNRMIKRREDFRPFAPSVLEGEAPEHFELDGPSPFMLLTCPVRSRLDLPAVTHVDGSARPQTVDPECSGLFGALLEAFRDLSGCPVLLNTSFNVAGEPIVCTPWDALRCFQRSGIDCLVLGDFLIERSSLPENWGALLDCWEPRDPHRGKIDERLYTFV